MFRNLAILLCCVTVLVHSEVPLTSTEQLSGSGEQNVDSGLNASSSGVEYGSGSGAELNGSGSGVEIGSGSGFETGSGSGMEVGSGSGAEELDAASGSGLETGSGSGMEIGSGIGMEIGSGSGMEIGSGSGMEVGSGSGAEELDAASGSGMEEASGVEREVVVVSGDHVNVFKVGRDEADIVLYQEAANIVNNFGSGAYEVDGEDNEATDEDYSTVPKIRAARAVKNNNSTVVKKPVKTTNSVNSTNSDDSCQANAVCYSDSECGENGRCLGVFVGKCNCNACVNLIACEDDSACGGLNGACNTTASARPHCDCLKAYKTNGFSNFMDALKRLCNTKECTGTSNSCFGLPCHSGRCVC